MNLKKAKKIAQAYKLACSDGVPPVGDFDWQPSPVGFKQADLNLACRVLGTSISKLQEEAKPKKEKKVVAKKAPVKKAPVKKSPPKKTTAKKAPAKKAPVKVEKEVAKVEEVKAKPAPKPAEAKKEVKEQSKLINISNMFKDKDGNGLPDYKDKKTTSSSKRKPTKKPDEKK